MGECEGKHCFVRKKKGKEGSARVQSVTKGLEQKMIETQKKEKAKKKKTTHQEATPQVGCDVSGDDVKMTSQVL